jgi:molybdopterin-guanine dinucleotide biosynthesis protein A
MKRLFLCNDQPLSLIVLAGGKSRRMRKNKALLPTPEGTIIERIIDQLKDGFDEIIISVNEEKDFKFLPYKLVRDEKPGQGPMMGIKSALSSSTHLKNFVIACDIPDIRISFFEKMIQKAAQNEIVIARSPNNRKEPLFGIYSKSVLPRMDKLLRSGKFSLLPLFEICQTLEMEISDSGWFKNLNTLNEYKKFLREINGKKSAKH